MLTGYLDLGEFLHHAAWRVLDPDLPSRQLDEITEELTDLTGAVDELLDALEATGRSVAAAADGAAETGDVRELVDRIKARTSGLQEIRQLTEGIIGQNQGGDP